MGSLEDIRTLLSAGADKVSVNTAVVKNPDLIRLAAERFGSQCVVVAIDAKRRGSRWEVFTHGGRTATGLDAVKWAKKRSGWARARFFSQAWIGTGPKKGMTLSS